MTGATKETESPTRQSATRRRNKAAQDRAQSLNHLGDLFLDETLVIV
jgi:hypothetical protein